VFTRQKWIFPASFLTFGFCLGLVIGVAVAPIPAGSKQKNTAAAESAGIYMSEAQQLDASPETQQQYQGYLGVYNNHLAVYEGLPPTGTLKYVMMDYVARDDVRAQLEQGVPFTDTYDLLRILENYTS